MNDDTSLTEIYLPEPAVVEDLHLLANVRAQIKGLKAMADEIASRLGVIPDGVLLRHETFDGVFYRQRPSLRPTILDLNAVPPHLLKRSLAKSIVNEFFRQTGEIPPGIDMKFGRGSLYLLPKQNTSAA